jgi:hypothetical protein
VHFLYLEEISSPGLVIERYRVKLPHPETSDVARDIVPADDGMERFARKELLGDPSFEFDAMGTVFGHDFQSPAAWLNRNL